MSTITSFKTGRIRASYANVFQPRLNELSGKMEYSMQLIIDKTDRTTLAAMSVALDAAKKKKWPAGAPADLRLPKIVDCDADPKKRLDAALKGKVVVSVKSANKPGIVDTDLVEIVSPEEFQSGDYCRVSLNAYAYGGKGVPPGVAIGLNNIQVLEKGESFGRPRASEDFA